MSICFRRCYLNDLDRLIILAQKVEPGLTLPNSPELLEQLLLFSDRSFNKTINSPGEEYYFFVLEDLNEKKIIGTSVIQAYVGSESPFYSFKLENQTKISKTIGIKVQHQTLTLVTENAGKSELSTLFLDPVYRNHENGNCLSRSRFLFIKFFPERFCRQIIAELRGVIINNSSPFYDKVIFPFLRIPFNQALNLVINKKKEFIAELLPFTPIYADLLPINIRKYIGQIHPNTAPAQHMLAKQGFEFDNYVHIFDAGPTMEATIQNIRTIKNTILCKLCKIKEPETKDSFLISNTLLDFKAMIAGIDFTDDGCILSQEIADCLGINIGDQVLISSMS